MKLIVCVDNNNGVLFNHRRLSSDRLLCQHILDMAQGTAVWVTDYSRILFDGLNGNLCSFTGDLELVAKDAYLFVEDLDIAPLIPFANELILYRWNRTYPSDVKLPISLPSEEWRRESSQDFCGKSHKQITQEVYKR